MTDEANPAAPEGATIAAPIPPPVAVVEPPPQPAPDPEPAPVPDLDKIGAAKLASFVMIKRARASEYTDLIDTALRRQFLVPAGPATATEYKLADQSVVVFAFPTNPGVMEFDALTAFRAKAL